MITHHTAPWLFIIDTEDYAGNFERELCAYITGRVGECGVGDDMGELFTKETKMEPFENIIDVDDDDGYCKRPATIWPTPGWSNNGFGYHFKDSDEAEALVVSRKQTAEHLRRGLGIQYYKAWMDNEPGRRDDLIKAGWTEEKLKKSAEDDEKKAKKAEKATKIRKWPAYNSVAIAFESRPTPEQIELMKSRAFAYCKFPAKFTNGERISKITGFRIIKNIIKKKTKEESV